MGFDQYTTTGQSNGGKWIESQLKYQPFATQVPRRTMTHAVAGRHWQRLKAPSILLKLHFQSQSSQGKTSFADMKKNVQLFYCCLTLTFWPRLIHCGKGIIYGHNSICRRFRCRATQTSLLLVWVAPASTWPLIRVCVAPKDKLLSGKTWLCGLTDNLLSAGAAGAKLGHKKNVKVLFYTGRTALVM